MKKLLKTILWSICLPTTFLQAQTPDSTLVFETEEVVQFQKQSLLKEFQIPYEQDVDRKRLIRLGIQTESAYPGVGSPSFIDFHQKLGMQNSILAGVALGGGNAGEPFFCSKIEFRHFIGMKKRIEREEQKNNFNGNYLAFTFINAIELGNRNESFVATISDLVYNRPFRQVRNSYAASFGTQLGGVIDFALQAGIKEVRPTAVGSNGLIIYDNPGASLQLTPFIGTRSAISFDFGKRRRNVNCDFVNCFREMSSVWKLGMSNLFYADLQEATINLTIDYEKRIAKSSFSWNSALRLSGGVQSKYRPTGNSIEIERSFGFGGIDSFKALIPTFLDDKEVVGNASARLEQNIRWYAFQKRNIAKAKTAQNLNGFYVDASAAISTGDNLSLNLPFEFRDQRLLQEIGGGLGIQKIIGSKYFTDFSMHYYPLTNVGGWNQYEPTIYAKLNFGLAKRGKL